MSRKQHDAKTKSVNYTIILVFLCKMFPYDFSKIRNFPKIFLRSFENVSPGHGAGGFQQPMSRRSTRQAMKPW